MLDHEGISGHRLFIKRAIARLASGADPVEEAVQLASLRENLLYEDRAIAATLINSAIYHLRMMQEASKYVLAHRMKAVDHLNKAVAQLPQVAI